jgi:hypothetical protein
MAERVRGVVRMVAQGLPQVIDIACAQSIAQGVRGVSLTHCNHYAQGARAHCPYTTYTGTPLLGRCRPYVVRSPSSNRSALPALDSWALRCVI